MNGAESAIATLAAGGIDICFANPGTTELPFVAALTGQTAMRTVLALHENVATGAADGYARMTRQPAATLLHLGPGLANGMANLHNAKRAGTPIVNLIGEHTTWHRGLESALEMDIEGAARTVSRWVRTVDTGAAMGTATADAVIAARRGNGGIATLIAPADCQSAEAQPGTVGKPPRPSPISDDRITAAVAALRGERSAILLGGAGLSAAGLEVAGRVAEDTGATLLAEGLPGRVDRGRGRAAPIPIPYWPELAIDLLSQFTDIVLAGAADPVSLFGYPKTPSRLIPETCAVRRLAGRDDDVLDGLTAVADTLGAGPVPVDPPAAPPPIPSGALTPEVLAAAVAAVQPENAIIMGEAVSAGFAYGPASVNCPPFTQLSITGAAIGQGMPTALGAALACPDRPVIALQADGSGLYTPQALWSMAREQANVTVVVCRNRAYKILEIEMQRAGQDPATAAALTHLTGPEIDWPSLAKGFGVPARSVDDGAALAKAVADGVGEPGPFLIEACMP